MIDANTAQLPPITEQDRAAIVHAAEHALPPQGAAFILPFLQNVPLSLLESWRDMVPKITAAINARDSGSFVLTVSNAIRMGLGLSVEQANQYALIAWGMLEAEGFRLPELGG